MGFLKIQFVAKYQKISKRETRWCNQKIHQDSQVGILSFRGYGRRFCFGRDSDVCSMFWICVVQVEQMNKKVDLLKKV